MKTTIAVIIALWILIMPIMPTFSVWNPSLSTQMSNVAPTAPQTSSLQPKIPTINNIKKSIIPQDPLEKALASAKPDDMIRVLIEFESKNDVNSGVSLLTSTYGSKIKILQTFKYIPVASSLVPAKYVKSLEALPGIKKVWLSQKVYLMNNFPRLDNAYDLGSSSYRWKDGWFSGNLTAAGYANVGSLYIVDTLTISSDGSFYGKIPLYTSLPSASSSYDGRIIRVRSGSGSKTKIYICVVNSSNSYEWVQIGEST